MEAIIKGFTQVVANTEMPASTGSTSPDRASGDLGPRKTRAEVGAICERITAKSVRAGRREIPEN